MLMQVLITLETSETINRKFVHPSRKHSPTITKVFNCLEHEVKITFFHLVDEVRILNFFMLDATSVLW